MWLKYYIIDNDNTLGMKFHIHREEVVIGGLMKQFTILTTIVQEFFKVKNYTTTNPNHNKIRFSFTFKSKKFLQIINEMREEGILIQETETLNRIFR